MSGKKQKYCFLGERWKTIEESPLLKKTFAEAIQKVVLDSGDNTLLANGGFGIDHIALAAAYNTNKKYMVYAPFINQSKVWPKETQNLYMVWLEKAEKKKLLSENPFSVEDLIKGQKYLVEQSDVVYLLFANPHKESIVKYARSLDKEIVDIMPKDEDDDKYITI